MERDLSDPGSRVAWAIAHSKRTAKALATAMGVSHATLSQWVHGETTLNNAKVGLVLSFCELTGVRVEWLLTGHGERILNPQRETEPDLITQARHFVHDLSPDMAATAYRLLAALEGARSRSES